MTFTFKGISARSMGLRVELVNDLVSSNRDVTHIPIPGRDGVLTVDNERYMTVEENIPVILIPQSNKTIQEHMTEISSWLLTDVRYHNFTWEDDPDFIYRAMSYSSYNLTNTLGRFGRGLIPFRFHPIKYSAAGLQISNVPNGGTVNNPFNIVAKPLITIHGQGNITLNIGSSQVVLQGVSGGGVIIDSETMTITDLSGTITRFEWMRSFPFPIINPGNQTVTWTGDATVTIMSRIGTVI